MADDGEVGGGKLLTVFPKAWVPRPLDLTSAAVGTEGVLVRK